MTPIGTADPGSFRDPTSRVLHDDGRILRVLDEEATADHRQLLETAFFERALADGSVVGTRPSTVTVEGWASVLEHDVVPVISYPYEWSFGMLREAALLQLDLTSSALEEGFITKDATPYNVQFLGSVPTFIDVGSFERLRSGEPWYGYRQFCQLFLNPLLLQVHRGLDLQLPLRASLEGISPSTTRELLPRRARYRRSTFAHVTLHARAERRYDADTGSVKADMRAAGFGPAVIAAQVQNLRRAVTSLQWGATGSTWSDYSGREHYEGELEVKEAFVREAVDAIDPEQVLDLGANDGHFSRIAAERADRVIAVDSDHLVVDRLHAALRAEGDTTILPLVTDLADPAAARGWAGRERAAFAPRVASDLVLCLAVVHHLALSSTIPFDLIVDQLAELAPQLVVELPHRDDPMVRRLLSTKRDGLFDHYGQDAFERALERRFVVDQQVELPSGNRTLYRAHRR